MRFYAFAVMVRSVLFAFFPERVFNDVFTNGSVTIGDSISGVTIAIFMSSLAVMAFSASYSKGGDLRRNTRALIVVELLTFLAPIKVLSLGLNYPHILSVFHFVLLFILLYLYQNQIRRK